MSEISLPSVPEFTASADPHPVRFTISVEGGYPASQMSDHLSALLAQLRHSLPAACRITLHESRPGLAEMTARQRQILQLLAQDLSNKDIGRRLGLSHFTVRNHVSQLLRMLGVSSRKAATALIHKMAEGIDQGGLDLKDKGARGMMRRAGKWASANLAPRWPICHRGPTYWCGIPAAAQRSACCDPVPPLGRHDQRERPSPIPRQSLQSPECPDDRPFASLPCRVVRHPCPLLPGPCRGPLPAGVFSDRRWGCWLAGVRADGWRGRLRRWL